MRVANKNTGIALITVILITAIISLVAFNLLSRQQIDIRRASNSLHWQQAYLYSVAVESWGMQLLVRDAKDSETNKIDHDNEAWATDVGTLAVDDGQITGEIKDLQGRFNLNNLIKIDASSGPGSGAAAAPGAMDKDAKDQFLRLLDALEINQTDLPDKIKDWIDADEESEIGGAEDGDYLSETIPHRAGNQFMASVTELLLVEDVTPEIYRKLESHVTALPTHTSINVNTASAPVLMSLATGITLSAAKSIIDFREATPFSSTNKFNDEVREIAGTTDDVKGIDVRSNYFLIKSKASFGDGFAGLSSIIARDTNGAGVHVLMRSQER